MRVSGDNTRQVPVVSHSSSVLPAAVPVVQVHCHSWRAFADAYAQDLSSGGMYVHHAEPLPLLSMLDVRLSLPESTEVVMRGRVVQVLMSPQAEQHGRPPGIAVELCDLDAERKRQIAQMIAFARTQAVDDDPHKSFARTLLELSPSIPPSEVAQRLSRPPSGVMEAPRADSRAVAPKPPANANATSTSASNIAAQAMSSRGSSQSIPITRQLSSPAAAALRARQISQSLSVPPQSRSSSSAIRAQPQARPLTEPTAPTSPAESGQVLKASAPAATSGTPRPSDEHLLKQVLSNVAHKHYDAALRITHEMLASNPGDLQALRWQATCHARSAVARTDLGSACLHYEHLLRLDAENREAREFVRAYEREKKLNSLPFGRYFTKKK